jgi:hypothetical protein
MMKIATCIVLLASMLVVPSGAGKAMRGLSIGFEPTDAPTPAFYVCPICDEGEVVANPDDVVDAGPFGNFTCLDIVAAANAGLISEAQCLLVQPLAQDVCECEAVVDPTEAPADPTEAPTEEEADPTDAPVDPTEAPTEEEVDPTDAPVDPTEAPTEAEVVDPTAAPVDPTEAPTEEEADPTEAPVPPTDAPTEVDVDAPIQAPSSDPAACLTISTFFRSRLCRIMLL